MLHALYNFWRFHQRRAASHTKASASCPSPSPTPRGDVWPKRRSRIVIQIHFPQSRHLAWNVVTVLLSAAAGALSILPNIVTVSGKIRSARLDGAQAALIVSLLSVVLRHAILNRHPIYQFVKFAAPPAHIGWKKGSSSGILCSGCRRFHHSKDG